MGEPNRALPKHRQLPNNVAGLDVCFPLSDITDDLDSPGYGTF